MEYMDIARYSNYEYTEPNFLAFTRWYQTNVATYKFINIFHI